MRARDFLLEYDQAKTLANFSDKIIKRSAEQYKRDGYTMAEVTPAIAKRDLGYIEKADPTAKKAYVLDLLRMYLDGSMARIEDVFKATEPLKLYSKFRNRNLPSLRTMTFTELLDLGDELSDVMSQSETSKAEEQAFYDSEQAYVAHDTDAYKVIVPFTEEASKFFGRGTRWCTAAESNNMFSEYYKGERDPAKRLWIVIFKGQKGKKWQLHIATGQFMDARDESLAYKPWFEETDFVQWFTKSVMRPCMPKYWEKIYKYYPDMDSLPEPLKIKILAANMRLISRFANPSDVMISAAIQNQSESSVKQCIWVLVDDPKTDDIAARMQAAALREFGIAFAVPFDIRPQNKEFYDDLVRKTFAKATPNSAVNIARILTYMSIYALKNKLCGDYKDQVLQGLELS